MSCCCSRDRPCCAVGVSTLGRLLLRRAPEQAPVCLAASAATRCCRQAAASGHAGSTSTASPQTCAPIGLCLCRNMQETAGKQQARSVGGRGGTTGKYEHTGPVLAPDAL